MVEVGGISVALTSRGHIWLPEVLVISWMAVLVVSLRRQVKPRGGDVVTIIRPRPGSDFQQSSRYTCLNTALSPEFTGTGPTACISWQLAQGDVTTLRSG
ncbi:hypothetical protein F5Y07DRAFT_396271 [Xylaria sp. FL0933]|nr:hypothetical protein F5Y07DRAFT_396271 [Xylaria sp. FL0933]